VARRNTKEFLTFLVDIRKYFHGVYYDRITLLSNVISVLFNSWFEKDINEKMKHIFAPHFNTI
jgi:hypothetical protein